MISLNEITAFDVVVLLVFITFITRGGWIGFKRQLAVFFALLTSYWFAGNYTGQMAPYVSGFIENGHLLFGLSFGILFLLIAVLSILTGKVLQKVMEITIQSWFDRLLGLLLGGVKAYFILSIVYIFVCSSFSSGNQLIKKSLSGIYLTPGVIFVKSMIVDPEVLKLFMPKEPAIKQDLEYEQAPQMPQDEVQGEYL